MTRASCRGESSSHDGAGGGGDRPRRRIRPSESRSSAEGRSARRSRRPRGGPRRGGPGPLRRLVGQATRRRGGRPRHGRPAPRPGLPRRGPARREATRAGVLGALESGSGSARPGDLFVLSFAGCGGKLPDANGDEPRNEDDTWCLHDGQLVDDELLGDSPASPKARAWSSWRIAAITTSTRPASASRVRASRTRPTSASPGAGLSPARLPRSALVTRTTGRAAPAAWTPSTSRRRRRSSSAASRARRFRRSPTTPSSPTATPARSSPPTAPSSGCARRASIPQRLRRGARPLRRRLAVRPLEHGRAGRPPLRAGHEHRRDDMDDADGVDDRPRRAGRRPLARPRRDQGDRSHPAALRLRLPPRARPHRPLRPRLRPARDALRAGLRLRQAPRDLVATRVRATASPTPPTARPSCVCTPTSTWGSRAASPAPAAASSAGEGCFFALSWSSRLDGPSSFEEAEAALDTTSQFWRGWLASGDFPDHRWREHLQRSALVLKGLTYLPTGAMVAALTTSLPETPGGERNWDYRYTWMRDATFTLQALHSLGLEWEADDFIQFVGDVAAQRRRRPADHVRDRRREGAARGDARPPDRLRGRAAGAPRQRRLRPAPERRLRRGARLDLPASEGVRPQLAAPVARDRGPGPVRRRRLAPARPGDLGVPRRAAGTTSPRR